ncbi:MAG: MFS transporter [Promethearchaeota archaeon]
MKFFRQNPILSLLFIFSLILINGIGATLPIPNLTQLADYYNFPLIGFIEGMFVVISTFFLFVWGFCVDKLERRQILWIANLIWVLPASIIFLFPEFLLVYFLGRMGMAIGLSAFSPIAYSILADYAKYEDRGLISSGLNIVWVGSSAAGILLGGFFYFQWNLSFGFLALFGFLILGWQFFIHIPKRGNQEPVFLHIAEYNYPWRIQLKHVPVMLRSKTIFWLLVQGFFALIPGTIFTLWLVAFLSSSESLNIASIGIASVIAVVIASGRAVGYPFFGRLGDYFAKKQGPKVRGIIASLCMAGQAIFFFFAFMSVDSSLLNFILFSFFFWLGSFIGAASGPNRTSLLFDVSLPEHRGSLGAFFSITDQFGQVIGIVLSTILLQSYGFSDVFILSLVFYLFAAISWTLSLPHINNDNLKIQETLNQRIKAITDKTGVLDDEFK